MGSDINGEASDDRSGTSVSFSADGKRMAIGAYLNDGNGNLSGHVRVFTENAGAWTQIGSDINGEAPFDISGYSVSLSGDGLRVAIAAIHNDGNGLDAGHVRVYKLSGSSWIQVGPDIDGEAAGDYFGWSVAMSYDGKRVTIGAIQNDGNGTGAGHVRVYKQSGNNWVKVGNDIDGEAAGDGFGRSVSMSSDGLNIAIGAAGNDGNGTDAGHVRVFSEISGNWIQVGSDIDGESPGDGSGISVALSDNGLRVAIGAQHNGGNGTDAGHVRVYENNSGIWTQVGLDIDGETSGDRCGHSVSLSSDGNKLAIAAPMNDGNGTDAGHVRVFSEISGSWIQVGSDIDGESAGDQSVNNKSTVSINDSGNRVAIGAPMNDGNGINAGHVRVYDETPCDADMDSYDSAACGGADCNDNDASVNPNATEVCNGIDDDCDNLVDEETADADGDGICDNVDNCSAIANADQADADGDSLGDVCDMCPNDPYNDIDGDGICGEVDNCPSNANSGQEDSDCDTVGDACDVCPGGDDSVDNNNDGISDCSQLLNYSAYSADWKCGTNKIYVCHSGTTECISKNQLATHYGHGDVIGPCVSCTQNMIMPANTHSVINADGINRTIIQGESISTALNDITQTNQLVVHPNPVNEFLNISFAGEIKSLRIMSLNGIVVKFDLILNNHQLDISRLTPGIYFLSILSEDKWYQTRFIKM